MNEKNGRVFAVMDISYGLHVVLEEFFQICRFSEIRDIFRIELGELPRRHNNHRNPATFERFCPFIIIKCRKMNATACQ